MERKNKVILGFYGLIWVVLTIIVLSVDEKEIALFLNARPDTDSYSEFIIIYTDTLYYTIGAVAVLTLFSLFVKKLEPWRRTLVTTLFNYALTFGLTASLKAIIGRQRPYILHPDEINSFGETEADMSMPSGHSSYSAAISVPIALKMTNRILVFFFCVYNVFMMYTRLYLGLHWMSDVLVGSILGVGVSYLFSCFMDKQYEMGKMTKKVELIMALVALAVTIVSALL